MVNSRGVMARLVAVIYPDFGSVFRIRSECRRRPGRLRVCRMACGRRPRPLPRCGARWPPRPLVSWVAVSQVPQASWKTSRGGAGRRDWAGGTVRGTGDSRLALAGLRGFRCAPPGQVRVPDGGSGRDWRSMWMVMIVQVSGTCPFPSGPGMLTLCWVIRTGSPSALFAPSGAQDAGNTLASQFPIRPAVPEYCLAALADMRSFFTNPVSSRASTTPASPNSLAHPQSAPARPSRQPACRNPGAGRRPDHAGTPHNITAAVVVLRSTFERTRVDCCGTLTSGSRECIH